MKLALVDGTNAIMRRAMVQTDVPRDRVVAGTVLNILDFVREVKATHLIVAFDSKESLRRLKEPSYKGDRTVNTGPWANALLNALAQRGVCCAGVKGEEADDVIATFVMRTCVRPNTQVAILSSDNDLLVLREGEDIGSTGVQCYHYKKGGGFELATKALPVLASRMPLYNALVGKKNGAPGVEGIGPKKAATMLSGDWDVPEDGLYSSWSDGLSTDDLTRVMDWSRLLELRLQVNVPSIEPSFCHVSKIRDA